MNTYFIDFKLEIIYKFCILILKLLNFSPLQFENAQFSNAHDLNFFNYNNFILFSLEVFRILQVFKYNFFKKNGISNSNFQIRKLYSERV